jgi:hypothetical protein
VSWRDWLARLDEPRDVKRAVYRTHRLVGLVLFAGALFTLDRLWFHYEPGVIARIFEGWGDGELRAVFAEAAHLFLLAGNALALMLSVLIVFRPSLLKGLEDWADRVYGK